jgi:hypothetical protein
MDWKKCSVSQSVVNSVGFEHLLERGRQMHNQAVFDLFASLVSKAIPSLKKDYGMMIGKRDSRKYSGKLSTQYSS